MLTNVAGSVDVLDLSDPLLPQLLLRVPINTATGAPNSVAIHPQHDYFLVVTGTAGVVGTVAAHRLSDGALLASASVGIQPDAIAIAHNGQHAVVANEAEGVAIGNRGGAGSLSLINLAGFNGVTARPLAVTADPAGVTGGQSPASAAVAPTILHGSPSTTRRIRSSRRTSRSRTTAGLPTSRCRRTTP